MLLGKIALAGFTLPFERRTIGSDQLVSASDVLSPGTYAKSGHALCCLASTNEPYNYAVLFLSVQHVVPLKIV